MSLYKNDKSPYWQFDVVVQGRRLYGSTKARLKKDAEAVERDLIAKAKADIEQEKKTGNGPLLLRHAGGRYMAEVGDHHANAANTFTEIERLIGFFGPDQRLDAITNDDVARLVTWRRGQTVKGRKEDKSGNPVKVIAPRTANATTLTLKFIMNRAQETWGHQFPQRITWKKHMLKEPKERVRELTEDEADALDAAFAGQHVRTNKHQRKNHRDDYALWFEFCRLTGLRRNETLIRWNNVIWYVKPVVTNGITIYGRINNAGKGGKEVSTPITEVVKDILDQCRGDHDEYVFTYVCQRPRKGQVRGQRYPITPEGAKSQWRRAKARAKVQNFRFHDIRHDTATKLLRATGNLKLVQKALNHADTKTTVKYAHVLDDEVAAALSDLSQSRKMSRTMKKGVA